MARDNQIWPSNAPNYTPFLDNAQEIHKALLHFEKNLLSEESAVGLLHKELGSLDVTESTLDADGLRDTLEAVQNKSDGYQFFLINRFLKLSKRAALPNDSSKLRISSQSFRCLIDALQLPASFVYAITQHHLPCGRGFHSSPDTNGGKKVNHLWYLLPVRTQFKCNDKDAAHVGSTAGSNQMNPFYYLHLADVELDIRGSQIAVFCRYTSDGRRVTTVVINFMDGRWSKSVLEPKRRIKEGWEMPNSIDKETDPFSLHSVYFTSALRWWTNALGSVNDQLIAYELRLQKEVDSDASVPTAFGALNRALHSIAAHLQRYGSELASMEEALSDIVRHHANFVDGATSEGLNVATGDDVCNGLNDIASHLRQVKAFLLELRTKLENILALLFSCIQIANDRRMVANGEKMHAILVATQEDVQTSRDIAGQSKDIAEQSRILAEEMKQDSVAMKTIAVTTMFFLPGTSFAAFLAMPFFNSNKYLDDLSKIWVWIVCTVPSTVIAFASYFYWRHGEDRRRKLSAAFSRPPL